jgi:hypothetical protein
MHRPHVLASSWASFIGIVHRHRSWASFIGIVHRHRSYTSSQYPYHSNTCASWPTVTNRTPTNSRARHKQPHRITHFGFLFGTFLLLPDFAQRLFQRGKGVFFQPIRGQSDRNGTGTDFSAGTHGRGWNANLWRHMQEGTSAHQQERWWVSKVETVMKGKGRHACVSTAGTCKYTHYMQVHASTCKYTQPHARQALHAVPMTYNGRYHGLHQCRHHHWHWHHVWFRWFWELWWFWGGQSWQRGWFWFSFDTFTHPFGTIIGGVFTHGHQRRDAFRQCVSFWFAIFAKTGPAFGTTGFVAGVHVHVCIYRRQ